MTRRRLAAALLLAPVLALTACSAGQIGTVGLLRQDDGTLEVLVRLCRGSVDQLRLQAINSFPVGPDGESSSDGWGNIKDKESALPKPIVDVADLAMPFEEQALGPSALFVLRASGRDGVAGSGYFGASQLAEVCPGEVLAPSIDESDDVYSVVSPKEFERIADEFCS